MFRTSITRLRTWFETVDVLGDSPDDAPAPTPNLYEHPHRTGLRWTRERRPGIVQPRPAHCLCPIRHAPVRRDSRGATLQ